MRRLKVTEVSEHDNRCVTFLRRFTFKKLLRLLQHQRRLIINLDSNGK